MLVEFRCRSQSEPDKLHTVTVSRDGCACSCGPGFDGWCSHIDATLVCGERAMVPVDDHPLADKAMVLAGRLKVPHDWKAAWRKNSRWRGLLTGDLRPMSTVGTHGRPVVCFTGTLPRPRQHYLDEAEAAGWETIDRPHKMTAVLVAADPKSGSNKLLFAKRHGIAVLTPDEWEDVRVHGALP